MTVVEETDLKQGSYRDCGGRDRLESRIMACTQVHGGFLQIPVVSHCTRRTKTDHSGQSLASMYEAYQRAYSVNTAPSSSSISSRLNLIYHNEQLKLVPVTLEYVACIECNQY